MRDNLGKLVQKSNIAFCVRSRILESNAIRSVQNNRLLHFWNVIAKRPQKSVALKRAAD
jgi:hypothetical protein